MPTIKTFEDIESWKLARKICKEFGQLIDAGAFENNFRLIQQIEGAAGSVMDNIAEGFERGTKREFIQFLGYAKGSCGELRSQLYRAKDRAYINETTFIELNNQLMHTSGLIQQFIKYLQQSKIDGTRRR